MSTIGERIRIRREELGLSQEELASRLGYKSRSSINKIELNQRNLTQSKIKAIADVLKTTPEHIMGWDENPNKKETPVSQETHERTMYALDLLSKLSPEKREEALRYLDYLASQDKK